MVPLQPHFDIALKRGRLSIDINMIFDEQPYIIDYVVLFRTSKTGGLHPFSRYFIECAVYHRRHSWFASVIVLQREIVGSAAQ